MKPAGKTNEWAGFGSREDRQRARAQVVLADVGISPATLQRYYVAVRRLTPVLEQISTEADLDESIAEWIQAEFEDGTPMYLVADALSGLHHFEPFTKRRLVRSWRLYGIWRKYEVPCRAPPLPVDITLAMAGWCISHGQLVMGALILLGFHCLLRTGEILCIKPSDVLLSDTHGVLAIPRSKSGLRFNTTESVTITDQRVLLVLQSALDIRSTQGLVQVPFWQHSGSAFRNLFRKVLLELSVGDLNFKPYSIRRGGATHEYRSHGLMERTLVRGRWRNSNVARLYISEGLSMLPSLRMSPAAAAKIAEYSSFFQNDEHCPANGTRGKRQRRS